MSDEEPVDPKKILEDTCKAKCVRQWRAYEDRRFRVGTTGLRYHELESEPWQVGSELVR